MACEGKSICISSTNNVLPNLLTNKFSKMSSLLAICITLVSFSMNLSSASQTSIFNGNETDHLALLEFKSKFKYDDPDRALDSWNHSDHCSWIGIRCNREHPRRVTVLDLSRQVLGFYLRASVSIPPDIGKLTFLKTLRLGYNGFYGEIPQELGGLSRLQNLDLSYNQLSGEIPKEIGGLVRLQYLDLSYNQLQGEIPRFLNTCLDLKGLYLNDNNLEGIIPPSLQSLKGIQELILDRNNISGPIPEYLGTFLSLKKLNLSWNNFEGEVPKEWIFKNTSAFSYNGNSELCGGDDLLRLPSCPESISNEPFSLITLLLILSGVVFCVTIILGSVVIFFSRRIARNKPSSSESPVSDISPKPSSSEIPVSDMLQNISYKPSSDESPFSDMFHKVSYKELLGATDGFSVKNLIGVGGYRSVYIGILMLSRQITTVVAVKVLDLQTPGALKCFKAECDALTCIRHRNVMKILTACSSVDYKGNEFKALVYEFMPNGSLENWLHSTTNNGQHQRSTKRPLKFIERLNIAIDVASALDYLHRQCQTPIAHCDLKPSNLLLDEDMNGHLGDFGTARFLHGVVVNVQPGNQCSSSFGMRGSIGYFAPEYGMGKAVSTNGDFYSLGIVLLELLTGKRPTGNMFKDGLTLHSFAKKALNTNGVMQIVDPTLIPILGNEASYEKAIINGEKGAKLQEALTEIIKLGVTCSIESPKGRMEMVLVLKGLQSIKNVYLF